MSTYEKTSVREQIEDLRAMLQESKKHNVEAWENLQLRHQGPSEICETSGTPSTPTSKLGQTL